MSRALFSGALLIAFFVWWKLSSKRSGTPPRNYRRAFFLPGGPRLRGAPGTNWWSPDLVASPAGWPGEGAAGRPWRDRRQAARSALAIMFARTAGPEPAKPAGGGTGGTSGTSGTSGAPAEDPAGRPPRRRVRRIGAVTVAGLLGIGLGVVAVQIPDRVPAGRLPSWVPLHPVSRPSHPPRPRATGPADVAAPAFVPVPMFAPYFMTWTGESPAALSQQSGVKYLMLAFIVAPKKGSCTVYWNGETHTPISRGVFGADIDAIRARGGDVIPSFGGGVDGTSKLEIADACTDINAIATAYENVITTYNLTRIDMNIEGTPAWDTVAIDRRNKALKLVQDWAVRLGRPLQVSYTLSAWPHGLADSGLGIMRNAVKNGVRVDVVNIMPFDYCDKARHSMVAAVKEAVTGMHDQLLDLYPRKSPAEIWYMLGVTVMVGIDDCGAGEIFTLSNAPKVVSWAASMGVALLSFWALQRDNGGCPGATSSSGRCSGITQTTWQFTQAFAPFPAMRRGV